jgi:O-antigen/teichoic acid export membrane protein/glycosyltransferase involved in cell wall biosynthesis
MTISRDRKLLFSVIVPTHNRHADLRSTLASLKRQTLPSASYEIIVVDDGSTDQAVAYLAEEQKQGSVRALRQENKGPAAARNAGVQVARGEFLAFTDDDCVVPENWLSRFSEVFSATKADAIGGTAENKVPFALSAVYQDMATFFYERENQVPGRARFLTTNNFACKREVLETSGLFDQRFRLGGSDRELVLRLVRDGKRVVFEPTLKVEHHHRFTLYSYLSHLYRQGRGSQLLYRIAAKEKNLTIKRPTIQYYRELFSFVVRDQRWYRKPLRLILAFLAQIAIVFGFVGAALEGVRDFQEERTEHPGAAMSGLHGTMLGLLTFLGGNVMSSVFGFISFIIIARALSVQEFGIFTLAFSLTSILSMLAQWGLGTSVIRHATEFSKRADEEGAATILKSALVLQVTGIGLVVSLFLLLSGELNRHLLRVSLPADLLGFTLLGAAGSVLFDFLVSAYSIRLRFLNLSILKTIVSLVRVCLVAAAVLNRWTSPSILFLAFVVPYWIGAVASVPMFRRTIGLRGSVQLSMFRRILAYGGWQTISRAAAVFLRHAGPFILAAVSTEKEVGIYGLGLSLSFIYGVVLQSVSSYFLPIGARLSSDDSVEPFIRRTLRLSLPLIALCLVSLVFAYPFVTLVYGPEKTDAVPVFVLLSLTSIAAMGFSVIQVLFHYFFKPQYISIVLLIRLGVFLVASFLLSSFGGVGIAVAFLAAEFVSLSVSFALLHHKFKEHRIVIGKHLWKTFGYSSLEQ